MSARVADRTPLSSNAGLFSLCQRVRPRCSELSEDETQAPSASLSPAAAAADSHGLGGSERRSLVASGSWRPDVCCGCHWAEVPARGPVWGGWPLRPPPRPAVRGRILLAPGTDLSPQPRVLSRPCFHREGPSCDRGPVLLRDGLMLTSAGFNPDPVCGPPPLRRVPRVHSPWGVGRGRLRGGAVLFCPTCPPHAGTCLSSP